MNKFTIFLLTLVMAFSQVAVAQKKNKIKKDEVESEIKDPNVQKKKSKGKHQAWDAGIMAGTMFYYGELHCTPMWFKEIRPGGGLYARYSLSDKLATRINLETGLITGTDANYEDPGRVARNFSFSSNIYGGSLLLEWEPFGGWRYGKFNKFHRMLSPYVNFGIGGTYSNPKVDFSKSNKLGDSTGIYIDENYKKPFHLVIPIGGGVRYDLNKNWTVGVEGGFRIPITGADYLDGISRAGNPEKRDWYETANLTLGYRFPFRRDGDKDGVPDDEDACPDEAGTKANKGCPDKDGDGVADKLDACPDIAGLSKFAGCPDSDSDGIPDDADKCPNDKGLENLGGCPDSDEDGIADKDDKCPEEKGPVSNMGCPVIDSTATTATNLNSGSTTTISQPTIGESSTINSINTTKGQTTTAGTTNPANTYTTTTINNTNTIPQNTATTGGTTSSSTTTGSYTGQTTTDLSQLPVSEVVVLDGNNNVTRSSKSSRSGSVKKSKKSKTSTKGAVAKSSKRKSATTSSSSSYTGDVALAPQIGEQVTYKGETLSSVTAEDAQILQDAVNSIQFETGKSILKKESYATLSKISGLLQKYPTYLMRITGHTDNQGGSDLDNVKLSVARARAVYNYFLKKGITYDQLSYRGCGDGSPVDSNETSEGRYKNRRVEFDMLNK
jgi:OmpA-OmpF porin, OOP family